MPLAILLVSRIVEMAVATVDVILDARSPGSRCDLHTPTDQGSLPLHGELVGVPLGPDSADTGNVVERHDLKGEVMLGAPPNPLEIEQFVPRATRPLRGTGFPELLGFFPDSIRFGHFA
jgi:hypothetical protein